MIDIVANNVMATSTTPDFSTYMFKEPVNIVTLKREMSDDIFLLRLSIIITAPLTGIT
jgi:hypothetical protein